MDSQICPNPKYINMHIRWDRAHSGLYGHRQYVSLNKRFFHLSRFTSLRDSLGHNSSSFLFQKRCIESKLAGYVFISSKQLVLEIWRSVLGAALRGRWFTDICLVGRVNGFRVWSMGNIWNYRKKRGCGGYLSDFKCLKSCEMKEKLDNPENPQKKKKELLLMDGCGWKAN